MTVKDRTRVKRKHSDRYEEDSHHVYRMNKQREETKAQRALEQALRSRDYQKLINIDDIY